MTQRERDHLEALADKCEAEGDAVCELLRRIARQHYDPLITYAHSREEAEAILAKQGSGIVSFPGGRILHGLFFNGQRVEIRNAFFAGNGLTLADPSGRYDILGHEPAYQTSTTTDTHFDFEFDEEET